MKRRIPILSLLLVLLLTLSLLLSRFPRLKNLGSARPNVLIHNGQINQRELDRLRISSDELISELRQKDITNIDEVAYAILEQNGKISVIPRMTCQPPTREDLSVNAEECGIMHILISRGVINRHNLRTLNKNEAWLSAQLRRYHCRAEQIFLMTVNDSGEIYLSLREGAKQSGDGGERHA